MDVVNGNKISNSTIEITNTLKDIDLNYNDDVPEDEACTAPFEVLAEFLTALMARDYKNALVYCKLILQYEPNNKTIQDFHPLIQQKINTEVEAQYDCSSASEANENSKESEGSTEYYSSASGREDYDENDDDANVSTGASLSSDEDVDTSL